MRADSVSGERSAVSFLIRTLTLSHRGPALMTLLNPKTRETMP